MGVPQVDELQARIAVGERQLEVCIVSMGNPHCVLFVDDVTAADVEELGPLLEHHERFPLRTNVAFARARGEQDLEVRVWERGVGETEACGSGAAAAAAAALLVGHARSPVTVTMPGGSLLVEWGGNGMLRLAGPVEVLATGVEILPRPADAGPAASAPPALKEREREEGVWKSE